MLIQAPTNATASGMEKRPTAQAIGLRGRSGSKGRAARNYCISDITSCDMLPDCFSIDVLACISICFVVMFAVSDA